jgi:hypothetical protein
LFTAYSEDLDMSEQKLKEFVRQTMDQIFKDMPLEKRLEGVSAEELCKRLTATERLEGLPAEERLKGLSAEEVAQALSPETLEALVRKLRPNGAPPKPQSP